MNECEYKNKVKTSKNETRATPNEISIDASKTNLFDFTESRLPPLYRQYRYALLKEHRILDHVQSGLLYGMVEVDIHVPEGKYEQFSHMSPIFATVDIPFEDFGNHMQEYVKKKQLSDKPRRLLVGGMKAQKIFLHTDLLKWYIDHGLEVTKVYQVLEFRPQRCFQSFVNLGTDGRRLCDLKDDMKSEGDKYKLLQNSGIGSIQLNRMKHQNTRFIDSNTQAQLLINDPKFKNISTITDTVKEITMGKRSISCDLPIQLSFTVLQLAKLRILQIYYDFFQAKCEPGTYEICQMDTDSLYFSFSKPDLASIVKPEYKDDFINGLTNNCNDLPYGPDQGHFFLRDCCDKHRSFDKRTPGLFKMEATGTEMISLCSKTYSLKKSDGTLKFSSKGLNRHALSDPHEVYRRVLYTGDAEGGKNIGYRAHKGRVFTCEEEKKAISYFYCKRQVLDDGIRTRPIDTTLNIWPDRNLDIVTDATHPLWPETIHDFDIDGNTYPTLVDVCTAAMKCDDPDDMVRRALFKLKPYSPVGNLFFLAKGKFHKSNVKKTSCYYWTSGMSERALPLADRIPGLNKLGQIVMQIQKT